MGHDFEKGSSFAFWMKCSRDINLGRGGTRRSQETLGNEITQTCFLILLLLKTLSAITLKQQLCWKLLPRIVGKSFPHQLETKYFSIQTDETTDITVHNKVDNTQGQVKCVFLALESVQRETAELLFNAIDKLFFFNLPPSSRWSCRIRQNWAIMLGARNSVMSWLRCKQPTLVALHCHCHIAALIVNEACKVLSDEFEDLTTNLWYYFQKSPRGLRQFEGFLSFVECKPHKLLKACQTRWLSLKLV